MKCGKNIEFLNVKLAVRTVITRFLSGHKDFVKVFGHPILNVPFPRIIKTEADFRLPPRCR
jgi:hypothetical protein